MFVFLRLCFWCACDFGSCVRDCECTVCACRAAVCCGVARRVPAHIVSAARPLKRRKTRAAGCDPNFGSCDPNLGPCDPNSVRPFLATPWTIVLDFAFTLPSRGDF